VAQAYAAQAAAQRGCPVEPVAQAVDAHHVLLLLTATASLKLVADGAAHPDRAAAWPNVDERRARLGELLRRHLVRSGPAAELRRLVRRGSPI
jgi:hypothetical protein